MNAERNGRNLNQLLAFRAEFGSESPCIEINSYQGVVLWAITFHLEIYVVQIGAIKE